MRIDKFFISVIVMVVCLTIGLAVIGEQAETYDIDIDMSSEKTFPHTAEYIAVMQNATSSLREPLEREEDFEAASMLGYLLEGGYEVLTLTWNLLKVPVGLARDIYALFEIPPMLTGFFTVALVIAVIFTFVYLFFRFQPR